MVSIAERKFTPALIVVDFQEDFCPPYGPLPVVGGRDIEPAINELLTLPFALRIATRDWHPANHVSFAVNHGSEATPFISSVALINPYNPDEVYETRLWPVHCVQNSAGAQLVRGLDVDRLDLIIDKGCDPRVEMYSAFRDPFRNPCVTDSGLAAHLHAAAVTHVFVVGLAADFCVRYTAADAQAEGFETYIVEDATRAVVPEAWPDLRQVLRKLGIPLVAFDGPELNRVRQRTI